MTAQKISGHTTKRYHRKLLKLPQYQYVNLNKTSRNEHFANVCTRFFILFRQTRILRNIKNRTFTEKTRKINLSDCTANLTEANKGNAQRLRQATRKQTANVNN